MVIRFCKDRMRLRSRYRLATHRTCSRALTTIAPSTFPVHWALWSAVMHGWAFSSLSTVVRHGGAPCSRVFRSMVRRKGKLLLYTVFRRHLIRRSELVRTGSFTTLGSPLTARVIYPRALYL